MGEYTIKRLPGWSENLRKVEPERFLKEITPELNSGLEMCAEVAAGNIKEGIAKGRSEWEPLHPWTERLRDLELGIPPGGHPLVATGEMMNAVTIQHGKGWAFAGFLRQAASRSGESFANIGKIMEYGAFIRVTEKMRAWLHMRGLHLKGTTTTIKIPARPNVGPAADESGPQFYEIIEAALKRGFDKLVRS